MLSNFLKRFMSSISRSLVCFGGALGSFARGRLGALPGAGNTHWICALRQLPQGMNLSHLTLRRRHVTQLRGLSADDGVVEGSRDIGPEGAKVEGLRLGIGAPAVAGVAGVAEDKAPGIAAGSCGVDAAAGELTELSFGDERDEDSMRGVELG